MKNENPSPQQPDQRKTQKEQDEFRSKTKPPGQNPQANDDPSHDVHHDASRRP